MHNSRLLVAVNALATVATLVINGLANALPLNGLTTGEISDRFKVYFVPAGYVFSIWGLIYLGLIAFTIYQALLGQKDDRRLARIGWLYALSSLANIAWLFLWHYEQFPFTLLAMGTLLACLLAIYLRLDVGRTPPASTLERWCVDIPFSVYLGWISVATIANVTDVLWLAGWNGAPLTGELWAALLALVAAGLAVAMALTRRDAAYGLVIVWALIGVANKQAGVAWVPAAAWIGAAVAAVAVVLALGRRPARPQPAAGRA